MKNEIKKTQSEPPAVAGGLSQPTHNANEASGSNNADVQPPATAGGSDLAAENEQLKAELRMRSAKEQLSAKLKTAGARSPELIFEAIKGELQFGEDGSLANAEAVVQSVTSRFPEQFGTTAPAASIDAGAGGRSKPALTKEALSKMKPSEIAELDWAEVKRTLAG